jgi:hypothetical protein
MSVKRSGLMTREWQSALFVVTCILLFALSADALAERAIVSSSVLTGNGTKAPNDGVQVADFWDWLKENTETDYPGGGGDKGGGDKGGGDNGGGDNGGGDGGDSGGDGGHDG